MFVQVMRKFFVAGMYKAGTPVLKRCVQHFKSMVSHLFPDLDEHFVLVFPSSSGSPSLAWPLSLRPSTNGECPLCACARVCAWCACVAVCVLCMWCVQNREGITVEIFANQWFLTLYSYNFPLNYVFRIWDLFLSEGIDFILTMALAIFCHQQGAPPFPSISSPPPLP
jgi:hypothetical protein